MKGVFMFKKLLEVKPKEDFKIIAKFSNGENIEYDVKPLFNQIASFKDLRDIKGLFEQVKVDVGGYGVIWNDYIDLSSDEIYNKGTNI